ncbi:tyrosine-protein phosphatase [Lysinibacillus sp. SGAir0095]|uniref:tyrosine-protein phosphatase n=1 Tax=Lysinibacillus sp. SGAir0095 TaxID=2070463 RepID=UPI0010CCE53F|nr:CpsB/CapC family capsule biosynthesis tyrosine phosphatase [Lysinibacillus sp. SGAir0095]QCR31881.1 capsular biosynthesis protein [Lysinibacillus sp. SGAir0095]
MIDMHSHVLWNVDDGPKTQEESMQLLEQAAREGITDLISTSHSHHPQFNAKFDIVTEQIEQLQQELTNRHIPLTLYTGHEVRLNEKLMNLIQQGEVHRLANSSYLLLELPSSHVPTYTKNIINALAVEGITPIIAHPERNKGIAEKPERLERLIREGAVAQITAGSLAGQFGKSIQKLSLDLVRANLVHTYGSDVHNLTTRPFLFEKGLDYLEKKKELDSVDMLLQNNKSIIYNEPFVLFEPEEVKIRKWWSLL